MSNVQKDDCIILNKCIYGLVQSARQYYEKAVKILKNLGFIGGNVDPCLYMKKCAMDIVCIALHTDDNLMIGDMVAIEDAIAALKSKGILLKLWKGCRTTFPAK